jgi:hypothetical protein
VKEDQPVNDIMPPDPPPDDPDDPDDELGTDVQERLLGEVRRIAFDRSLSNDDIARGIRDAIREHDGEDFGDDD